MSRAAGNGGCYAAAVTDNAPTGPDNGGRLLVRLQSSEQAEASAAYTVALATASSTWEATATVQDLDGRVEVGTWSAGDPPPWLVQAAHALLRSAWQRKRAGHPWPRRLARWRPAPEASEP